MVISVSYTHLDVYKRQPLDSSYWIPIDTLNGTIASFTSDGQSTLELVVYGDLLRCTISGGGGSMSLNVTAQAV